MSGPARDQPFAATEVKTCCATAYSGDVAQLLLGASLHPGGLELTRHLGTLLQLGPDDRVLDVAAGRGASAIALARHFGCQVIGIDYSAASVAQARAAAEQTGIAHLVRFEHGDAEKLPCADGMFDALVCECAFCTFPDKATAAREFARVLRPGGRLGLSDLTRTGELPAELDGLLAWVACIADAQPITGYVAVLEAAGIAIEQVEPHDQALLQLVTDIRTRLLGAELLIKIKRLELPEMDWAQARRMARHAADAVRVGQLGYALLLGVRNEA